LALRLRATAAAETCGLPVTEYILQLVEADTLRCVHGESDPPDQPDEPIGTCRCGDEYIWDRSDRRLCPTCASQRGRKAARAVRQRSRRPAILTGEPILKEATA
jgi:hypothetical protein